VPHRDIVMQSIREMQRAGRTAQQVMDDATWGVLAADYRDGWGCDADHLKNTDAIDTCIAAGFIGFTLDPGEYVDDTHYDQAALIDTFNGLPWAVLETTPADFERTYAHGVHPVPFTAESVHRAACKYGRALAHVVTMARHIATKLDEYDLEISVDETETPTSPAEHYIIVGELKRLGIPFTGLAPRFIGRFEKGVDYIGDLSVFDKDFATHAAIRQHFGGYKLSIHSGSDKFSLYPIIARHANPYVHLKTAGTSWLEALRVVAQREPDLFRQVLNYARERYPHDMASYHVSAQIENIPMTVHNAELPRLLDQFDARQVLHVTFGSLLTAFGDPIHKAIHQHAADYRTELKRHFVRHISHFRTLSYQE
jgi:tagaturonate epimerase